MPGFRKVRASPCGPLRIGDAVLIDTERFPLPEFHLGGRLYINGQGDTVLVAFGVLKNQ